MCVPARSKEQQQRLDAAFARLADMMPSGHLHAGMDPAGFISAVCDELEGFREALTPSENTKAAYIGEFSFACPFVSDSGEEFAGRVNVPWTAIKQVMVAIRARATQDKSEGSP